MHGLLLAVQRAAAADAATGAPTRAVDWAMGVGIGALALAGLVLWAGGGHQAGFATLNGLGTALPATFWQGVTLLGDGAAAACVLLLVARRHPQWLWAAVIATVGVTYNDGTAGALVVALAATRRASLMIPLNGFIPAAAAGKYIRDIDTVQLSATTGSAGSFGFTATRPRMTMPLPLANKMETFDWAALGLPEIFNSSCLMILQVASTTSTGTVRGGGKLSHG